MTFAYQDSTAVIGPLAIQPEPGCYDLCEKHVKKMSVPQGWQLIKLSAPEPIDQGPAPDELTALADLIRKIGFADEQPTTNDEPGEVIELGRRGHLRVLADVSQAAQPDPDANSTYPAD